ncbi:MAG: hypothetical protein AT711_00955 [Thermoproteus sp. CIS_19]|nr:MAG: hypothetical protein AT711_00955 [Thermoproteus sp. CIS_19]
MWRVQSLSLYSIDIVNNCVVYHGQLGLRLPFGSLQKRIQLPAEIPQLVFLFGGRLKPIDNFLDDIVDVKPPRLKYPIHGAAELAVPLHGRQDLLHRRRLGQPQRELKATSKFVYGDLSHI